LNFFAETENEIYLISKEKPSNELNQKIIFYAIQPINIFSYIKNKKKIFDNNNQPKTRFLTKFLNIPFVRRLIIAIRIIPVYKLIREIKPDLIHAHLLTTYGLLGAMLNFHPFCISVWGSDILIDSCGTTKYISRYILTKADVITCDGENTREALHKLGIQQNKIHFISHGIDTKKFSPSNRDLSHIERIFGKRAPVVICIRGFDPIYDSETFIRSIPRVIKEIPNVNFLIAGDGSEEHKVKNLAESLGVSSVIKFTGIIPHDILPAYLASSDVYVSASLSDGGVAISTFEAMASGVPPIVTDVGDNHIWIKNRENGFIIPVRNPECLAEKIIYLLNHPEERFRFGVINRAIVTENQDYYKEMEKVHVLYKNLVKR
jgi:glycosyltransferase involved in cell wall biosynthesis